MTETYFGRSGSSRRIERHSVSSIACRLGREELERHVDVAAAEKAALVFGGGKHHAANSTGVRFFFSRGTAGLVATQSETVSFSGAPLACRRKVALPLDIQTRLFQPALELIGSKAEPAMGGLLAQEFELMRREVDHQQPAARLEQPRGFGDRGCRVVEEVQHLMQDHGIGRAVGKRHVVEIAVARLRVEQARRARASCAHRSACRG